MRLVADIVAAGDEIEGIFKILIGCVVAAVWLIGAAMSAKKKKPGGQQEKSWEQILRELGGETSAPPRQQPPVVRRPEPPPLPAAPPGGPKVRKPIRRGTVKKPARRLAQPEGTSPPRSIPVEPEVIVKPAGDAYSAGAISSTEIGSSGAGARHRAETAVAEAFGTWLKPATLKKQWILTEILRPPVTLRESGR